MMNYQTRETTKFGSSLQDLPGATRIGAVWLVVPPINIHYSNTKFEREMATLRQPSSTVLKTGRGLWQFDMDIVFSGVSMINDKLAKILGQIRRTPFTMMRNETVTKIISYNPDPNASDLEIPIAVTGYTINTETNLPDTIIMRLSFIIFNYRPFVNSMQFLKQTYNQDGTFAVGPTPLGIKDSNLYRQWCTGNPLHPYIIDNKDLTDFMFAGEMQFSGTHTMSENQQHRKNQDLGTTDNIDDPGYLVSRIDKQANVIVANADRIVKLPPNYVNEKQTLTLGYHVFNANDALDLRLGAYLSRRSKKWVWSETDRRADILAFCGIDDTGQDIQNVIDKNQGYLALLPAINNASDGNSPSTTLNKYVKKFRIQSDNTTNILGIAVRNSIPLSVLPIVSSPVPTVQYMGGTSSTITITIETTSEKFIETITAVDQGIEASSRHKRRHSGSELTYVENDIINLNGTFVVSTGDMDIQSVPDNPGCYLITYILREQSEVMNALTKPANEVKNLKKELIQGILSSAFAKNWQYKLAYQNSDTLNLTGLITDDNNPNGAPIQNAIQNISYLNLVVFPSWVRTIRNGFLQYCRQLEGVWGLMEAVHDVGTSYAAYWAGTLVNPVLGIAMGLKTLSESNTLSNIAPALAGQRDWHLNLDRLMFENPLSTEADIATIAADELLLYSPAGSALDTFRKLFYGNVSVDTIAALQKNIFNNRGIAYNQIWRVMTGQSNYPQGDPLYQYLRNYLQMACAQDGGETKPANNEAVQNNMIVGATAILASSDNRRWEALLRSPYLLDYELRLATGNAASINTTIQTNGHVPLVFGPNEIANAGGSKSTFGNMLNRVSTFFSGGSSAQRCYPDLGIPFTYMLEDNNGNYVLANIKKDTNGNYVPIHNALPIRSVSSKDTRVQAITWDQPSFYLQETGLLPSNQTFVTSNYHHIKTKIKNSSHGLESLFGDGVVSSNSLSNIGVTNDVTKFQGVASPSDFAGSSAASAANIGLRDDQRLAQKTQAAVTTALQNGEKTPGTTSDLAFGRVNSFKTMDDLFMSNSLGQQMGPPGTQTSPQMIAEAQYEHKTFKSSLVDLNPDLDHTLAGIITDAQNRLMGLPRYHSINKAYPTYKLYFRAEGNPEFFLFDNFYDYRAIESIRYYKDKASPSAVMNIVLNNYNDVLTDYSALLAKVSRSSQNRNNDERITNASNGKPLRSLFLEPGTQIQLKVGYDADPAKLTTIFNGFITEVSPGESYEIECQSYGAELFADADMGSFTGWVCPPKQFIWWMLMNPKIKHLGTLFQPTLLPQGTHDYLDGFLFDDNIFINQNLEPGKLRLFQVYNADNMSMWDVLQDIAAAHPGFICQTVPYDDRETLFFGRADHFYKYTQDLGVTSDYYAPLVNARGSVIDSITNQPASQNSAAVIENKVAEGAAAGDLGKQWFNYMQWLSINADIKKAMDDWRTKLETGQTNISAKQFENLLEYCRWVEILQNLAGDSSSGNIQYDISNNNVTSTAAPGPNAGSGTQGPDNSSSTQPTTTDKMSGKKVANAAGAPISNPKGDGNYTAPVAQMSDPVAKAQDGITPPAGIPALDAAIRSGILGKMKGKPIPFSTLIKDINARNIASTYTGNVFQDTTDKDPLAEAEQAKSTLEEYATTNNKGLLEFFSHLVGDTTTADDAQQFYEKFGIYNPIAILAWFKVAAALAAMHAVDFPLSGANNVDTAEGMAAHLQEGEFSSIFDTIKADAFSVSIPGITIDIVNRDVSGGAQLLSPYPNELQFRSDIFYTDLKAHQSLRQLILTSINNVNPAFQELAYFLGKSPIQKRFRNYHLKTSYEHICNNEIKVNFMGMWNAVKIKYKRNDLFDYYIPVIPSLIWGDKPHSEFHIQAGDTLYDRITRETTVTVENARTVGEARAYATSILAEGIRNMYGGQLTLVGDPEIKPTDVIFVYDDYNSMYGPVEVRSVTHVMDQSAGFITIVEPQAYVEPLGVSIGPAQIIHEIFDTLLLPVMFFAPEIGLAEDAIVGTGGLLEGAVAEAPSVVAKDVAEGFMAKTLDLGAKTWDAGVKVWQDTTSNVFDPVRQESFVRSFTRNLNSFAKGLENNGQLTQEEARLLTPNNVLAEIQKTQPGIKDLFSANDGDIVQALRNIVNGSSTTSADALNKAVSDFGFKNRLIASRTRGTVAGTAASLSEAVQGFKQAAVARLLGYGLLNTLKLLAVAAPIAYYQMFAGQDDPTYACPLRITPLQFNNQPYTAGLEGLTHQSGIWNHMAGQWRRFWGSMHTMGDALGETVSGIGDLLDR